MRSICTYICIVSDTDSRKELLSNNLNLIAAKNAILQFVLEFDSRTTEIDLKPKSKCIVKISICGISKATQNQDKN